MDWELIKTTLYVDIKTHCPMVTTSSQNVARYVWMMSLGHDKIWKLRFFSSDSFNGFTLRLILGILEHCFALHDKVYSKDSPKVTTSLSHSQMCEDLHYLEYLPNYVRKLMKIQLSIHFAATNMVHFLNHNILTHCHVITTSWRYRIPFYLQ